MDIEEIGAYLKTNVDLLLGTVPRSPSWQVRNNLIILSDRIRREGVDVVEDDEPPVSVDDGFAILPMERYEALRQAEENLQETRFEPADGEHDDKQATIDALKRRVNELSAANGLWRDNFQAREAHISAQALEIGRLKGNAKVRAEAAAPPRVADEVLLKHIRDHQAEIEGIKERLDEQSDRINAVAARLDAAGPAVGDSIGAIFDRMGALTARLNKLDAREVAKT